MGYAQGKSLGLKPYFTVYPSSRPNTDTVFKCDQCEYVNKTEKGLKRQTRMKHIVLDTPEMERQNIDEP